MTTSVSPCRGGQVRVTDVKRRKSNSKAKLERSLSHFLFQALRSRRFQRGFHRDKLHRPTNGFNLLHAVLVAQPVDGREQAVHQGLTLVHFQLNVSAFCGIWGALRVC